MENLLKSRLTLQQKELIQAAINFWNRPMIKEKLQKFFHYDMEVSEHNQTKRNFVKYVIKEGILIIVKHPFGIQEDLKYMVENVGIRIVEWLLQIVELLQISCNNFERTMQKYIDNMIFTTEGIIDSIAIYKKMFDERLIYEPFLMYIQACNCCNEDYIRNWKERFTSVAETTIKLAQRTDYYFHPDFYEYWFYLIADNNVEKPPISVREMLEASVRSGNVLAVKYFWERAKKMGISMTMRELANAISDNSRLWTTHSDIFIFLMFQILKPEELKNLLPMCEPHSAIYAIMSILPWPWYNLTMSILAKNLQSINTTMYISIFRDLLEMSDDLTKEIGIEIESIIIKYWSVSPAQKKLELCNDKSFIEILLDTFVLSDFEVVKRIINDDDITPIKHNLLDRVLIFFYKKIRSKNCIEIGTDPVVNMENRRLFVECKNLKFFGKKILTKLENRSFRHNLHAIDKCESSILQRDFLLAGETLKLHFHTPPRITEMKIALCEVNVYHLDYGVIMGLIWEDNRQITTIEGCIKRTKEFLNFLEVERSVEALASFHYKLKSSRYFTKMIHAFMKYDDFNRYDAMLNTCFLSRSELIIPRHESFRFFGEKKCVKYIKRNEFDKIEKIMEWYFPGDVKGSKEKFMSEFLLSRRGFNLCRSLIKPLKDYKTDTEILEFFDKFAKLFYSPSGINSMRIILKKWARDGHLNRKYMFNLKYLMKALRNRCINLSARMTN